MQVAHLSREGTASCHFLRLSTLVPSWTQGAEPPSCLLALTVPLEWGCAKSKSQETAPLHSVFTCVFSSKYSVR